MQFRTCAQRQGPRLEALTQVLLDGAVSMRLRLAGRTFVNFREPRAAPTATALLLHIANCLSPPFCAALLIDKIAESKMAGTPMTSTRPASNIVVLNVGGRRGRMGAGKAAVAGMDQAANPPTCLHVPNLPLRLLPTTCFFAAPLQAVHHHADDSHHLSRLHGEGALPWLVLRKGTSTRLASQERTALSQGMTAPVPAPLRLGPCCSWRGCTAATCLLGCCMRAASSSTGREEGRMAGQNGPRGLIACAPCSSPQTRQQRGMLHSREAFPAEAASAAAAADGAKRPARPGRDPTHFPTILTYLRDGHVPLPEAPLERQQLRAEAAFYSLTELVAAIDDAEAARAEEAAAERAKQEEAAQAARYVASHRVELLRGANEAVAHAEATLRQLQASQEAGRAAQRRVEERARRLQARGGRANTRLPRAVQPRGGVMQGQGTQSGSAVWLLVSLMSAASTPSSAARAGAVQPALVCTTGLQGALVAPGQPDEAARELDALQVGLPRGWEGAARTRQEGAGSRRLHKPGSACEPGGWHCPRACSSFSRARGADARHRQCRRQPPLYCPATGHAALYAAPSPPWPHRRQPHTHTVTHHHHHPPSHTHTPQNEAARLQAGLKETALQLAKAERRLDSARLARICAAGHDLQAAQVLLAALHPA